MQRLKQLIRISIAATLFYTGVLHLCAWLVLRKRIVVLTYHRVLPPQRLGQSFSAHAIVVSPEVFARHMACVSRWLHPLTQEQFIAHSAPGATPPPRSCLVTFDDGWYDNHEYALPVLRQFEVPMTLFVATNYIGSNDCFWQERLASLLFAARSQPQARELLAELGAAALSTMNDAAARHAVLSVVARVKNDKKDAQALIARLAAIAPSGQAAQNEDRFLTLAQLQELQQSGWISIGSHAMSHARLNLQADERIVEELAGSRDTIARWLDRTPLTLAYPNGDYDQRVIDAAAAAGYRASFTTDRGHFRPGDNPHTVKRINMHDGIAPTQALFLSRVIGLF
jgi:peptidoglycan/xylan/chitin deacetylase (PgdA/CDA1 family)